MYSGFEEKLKMYVRKWSMGGGGGGWLPVVEDVKGASARER
jgi:hypothetical protein